MTGSVGRPGRRPGRPGPVAILVHAYYEEDSRVRRQAESLVRAGRPVDVYALRRADQPPVGDLDGVRVHRLDVQRHQGAGLGTYLVEYLAFFVRAGWAVTAAHRRRRYAVVQVATLPDFLAFAALPLKLAGIPLVLDLHEAMPEFFRSRFPRAASPLAHSVLLAQERASAAIADAVLTVNDALADRLVALGVRRDKITVILNSPSFERFDPATQPARPFAADGALRLVYAGALSPVYELDVAFAALARLANRRPDLPVTLDLYGRDYGEVRLSDVAASLGVADRVRFHGRIPLEAVPAANAEADDGLAPTRRTSFTDFSLSTKVFEYAAMAKPVVASRLPMVERTFAADTVATYAPGDPDDLAATILRLVDQPAERAGRVERTTARVRELSWEREAERYIGLIDRLAAGRSPG